MGLGAIFSGGNNGQFNADEGNATGAYLDESAYANGIGGYGATQMGNWGNVNPMYQSSAINLAQQLQQSPTQQQEATEIGAENDDAATAYAKARASLMASASARGVQTAGDAGTSSSVVGGGLASLAGDYANTTANNESTYYQQNLSPQAQLQRQQQATQIYGDLAQQDWSEGIGAETGAADAFGRIGSGWSDMAGQELTQQQDQQAGIDDLLSGIGGGVGTAIGNGKLKI